MDDFGIIEMLKMQKALQEKYKDIWETISPEIGKNKLLWMIFFKRKNVNEQFAQSGICQDMAGSDSIQFFLR